MVRFVFTSLAFALLLPAAELPVREVVLYKHGVGFFERSGRLAPGESVRLDFNAPEMNDVLKSLTLTENGGGKIEGIRYDSSDPHKLADFPFEIGNDGLPGFLDRLRGARVQVKLGAETIGGAIVNARTVPGTGRDPERDQLNLLLDSGDLRTLDLNAIAGLRFADAKLQEQFRAYLAALAAVRSKDKRSVYIDSTGTAARDIVASYMIPSPVWKSTYRLIFAAGGQPILEGWAIVDNTTGEDWKGVRLSLVSGRPISFITQLYAPKYVDRPTAELADDTAARPILHAAAYAPPPPPPPATPAAKPRAQQQQFGAGSGGGIGGGVPGGVLGGLVANDVKSEVASSIAPENEARELGELFEYRVSQPVTIRSNESAMLPFLQQPIEGRKLLIYADHSSSHPTNAVELNNSTGKTLDGGPITVYDSGAYGGEALMETLKAGDRRLISYAVDLGSRITEAFGSSTAVVREIHAVRGIVTMKMAAEETRTYTIRNVDQKAKTLILEHPLRQGYTLLNQKPTSKTSANYRFEVPLAAAATQEFKVSEERVFAESTAVANLSPDTLLGYIGNRQLSAAGRQQLQKIADQKRLVAENDQALHDVQTQIADLGNEESRIRQNIQTLISVREQQQLVQTYARQLDTTEQKLVGLRDRQAELQKKKTALQTELDGLVEALSF